MTALLLIAVLVLFLAPQTAAQEPGGFTETAGAIATWGFPILYTLLWIVGAALLIYFISKRPNKT